MLRVVSLSLLVAVAQIAVAAETVKLEKKENAVAVTIDGKPFTTYYTADSQRKPFFHPVLAADGAVMTRPLENPKDHQHHKGVWCSIDQVNGIKYWMEAGKIENASVEIVKGEGNPAQFRTVNHWLDAEGKPLVKETVNVNVYANRLFVYDAEFTSIDKSVTWDDTKEGMFGIRLADPLRGQVGGTIVNADGLKGEKECWGKESNWVDYYGDIDGRIYGVALFDDPSNFRKSRYHVRNYGLFTMSPFGQHDYTEKAEKLPPAPLTVEPGKSFKLRYGLYVHNGDTTEGGVAQVYDQFAKGGGK